MRKGDLGCQLPQVSGLSMRDFAVFHLCVEPDPQTARQIAKCLRPETVQQDFEFFGQSDTLREIEVWGLGGYGKKSALASNSYYVLALPLQELSR